MLTGTSPELLPRRRESLQICAINGGSGLARNNLLAVSILCAASTSDALTRSYTRCSDMVYTGLMLYS